MRRTPLFLCVLPLILGCVDGLGLNSTCSAEMQGVRFAQGGGPPDETQRDEDRGDFVEQWYFYDSNKKYTFRWGVSYQRCQVQSASFSRSPTPR